MRSMILVAMQYNTSRYLLDMLMLESVDKQIGYRFHNVGLLQRALTHRSVCGHNNERLEFLGDSILSVVISAELFQRHPGAREGELSRMRSFLVSGEMLATLAKDLLIGEHLILGVGESRSGGQYRESILADALEAIIGAIFLDGGFDVARERVLAWYGQRFDDLSQITPQKDAKSRLQEWLQAHKYPLPKYSVKISGKAHAQTFVVCCQVQGLTHVAEGISSSRRRAEQLAAANYLELLDD